MGRREEGSESETREIRTPVLMCPRGGPEGQRADAFFGGSTSLRLNSDFIHTILYINLSNPKNVGFL